MSFHTWQKEGDLKPQIIFKGMDIKHKYDTTFLSSYLTEDRVGYSCKTLKLSIECKLLCNAILSR